MYIQQVHAGKDCSKYVSTMHLQACDPTQTRTLDHYLFTGWPDYGAPKHPTSLIRMLYTVRDARVSDVPILLHCRWDSFASPKYTSSPTYLLHHIIQCWCGKDRDLHCSGHHSGQDECWKDSGHQRNNGEDEREENVHDSDSGRCEISCMHLYNAYIIVSSALSDHYV